MSRRTLSCMMVFAMLLTLLVGCSNTQKPADNSTTTTVGTTTTVTNSTGTTDDTTTEQLPTDGTTGGTTTTVDDTTVTTTTTTGEVNDPWAPRKVVTPSNGDLTDTLMPKFTWKDVNGAKSYTIKVEAAQNGSYTPVFTKSGLKDTEYVHSAPLAYDTTYRYTVLYNNGSKEVVMDNFPVTFYTMIDSKNHPANKGRDYTVDGKVSEEVLKNYLSRSIIFEGVIANFPQEFQTNLRKLLQSGAKYIARSAGSWLPSSSEEANFNKYHDFIEQAHKIDPEMVFEFCVFECVSRGGVESIMIPEWVFEAFGKTPEFRSFNMEYMRYPSGKYVGEYGMGTCNVDITRTETQMFYYYRACRAIDAGFEGIHWGAMELSAEQDDNYACWTKVVNMVREYAKKHARRGFVFNNAHTCGILGSDNMLVFDFHCKPSRIHPTADSVNHVSSESNPQKGKLSAVPPGIPDDQQHLIIYKKSLGGKTHSGWTCKSLPYFVELDNWGGAHEQYQDTVDYAYWPWGYDEISWFANQPLSYQKQWIAYAYQQAQKIDPQCFFEMPGGRTSWLNTKKDMGYFSASDELLQTYRDVWVQNK